MSTPAWDTIPLLALKCILEHLDERDALSASTTCCHWRSAMLMYEGRRDLLILHADEFEKNSFIVPLFKKQVQRLHIHMEHEVNEATVNAFTSHILPHFLDSVNLQEIMFVGPILMTQKRKSPYAVLKRIVVETLVYKHTKTLKKLGLFGCEISSVDESDGSVNEQFELYSKQLSLKSAKPMSPTASEDLILCRENVEAMPYSNLKHIVFDLELVSTDAIATLAKLDNFKLLTLNVTSKKGTRLPRIDWKAVKPLFKRGLEVAMNIIKMPHKRMHYVIKHALCPDIPMVAVKFLFCRYFYMQIITRVAQEYSDTLREFSWVDSPRHSGWAERLIPIEYDDDGLDSSVNPLVLLAWQCPLLKKLDLHGYWFCEYDLVGIARLRPTAELNVSSVYDSTAQIFEHKPALAEGKMVRVLANDSPPNTKHKGAYLTSNGIFLRPCTPSSWERMHEGLKADSTAAERADYIVSETTQLEIT